MSHSLIYKYAPKSAHEAMDYSEMVTVWWLVSMLVAHMYKFCIHTGKSLTYTSSKFEDAWQYTWMSNPGSDLSLHRFIKDPFTPELHRNAVRISVHTPTVLFLAHLFECAEIALDHIKGSAYTTFEMLAALKCMALWYHAIWCPQNPLCLRLWSLFGVPLTMYWHLQQIAKAAHFERSLSHTPRSDVNLP